MKNKTRIFEQYRSELFNIAYGMLGHLPNAQDIVQDAYIRWNKVNLNEVDHPGNYLKTIVSRLCIDHFRSAKSRREEYIGPWLPQPVTDENRYLPDYHIELHDELSIALLHLLENLSPDQRAIYLLHDVFGYTFTEVSDLVGKKPATCRKAAQRARTHIQNTKPLQSAVTDNFQQVVHRFIEAIRKRDIDMLKKLLKDDVVMYSDGGGKATTARKPIKNSLKVSTFLINIANKSEHTIYIEEVPVNGRAGFKAFINGNLHSIWTFSIDTKQINTIFSVLNPDKLSTVS